MSGTRGWITTAECQCMYLELLGGWFIGVMLATWFGLDEMGEQRGAQLGAWLKATGRG